MTSERFYVEYRDKLTMAVHRSETYDKETARLKLEYVKAYDDFELINTNVER